MKRFYRWWKLRKLRCLWADDMQFRSVARRRGWLWVLDQFDIESRYHLIRQYAKAEKMRGNL
ncbi:hypothetical protein [Serratia sp. DD3]|uniref:hypothetical protein n=1 Tax=Serratia sp. DD3 TaxID=1410619 RepID=UPI0003C4F6DF|nr:hypothetical protein [Serratia sp. DD3]KEY58477.1 hypothetical protein SRDD_27240 [Serratia sp. DD3]